MTLLNIISAVALLISLSGAARAQSVAFQYTTTADYGSGFTGEVKIINNGSQTISDWTVAFDFDRSITSIYNASIISHVGIRYTVRNAGFNSTIPPGGSATFGFTGNPGNVTNPPANFAINLTGARSASEFAYQGRLDENGAAANGVYDLQFALYDDATGAQVGATLDRADVTVVGGVFYVPLDFGAGAFGGANGRSLEIRVRRGARSDAFTTLAPRQPITNVPYAVRAASADLATTAQKALDVQIVLSFGAPAANLCDNSAEYGQMRVDPVAGRLYVCVAAGWKSTILQ